VEAKSFVHNATSKKIHIELV